MSCDNNAGRFVASLTDAEKRAHPKFPNLVFIENVDG